MRSKILVVEDEAAINDLICLSLETAGYETVSSGMEEGRSVSGGLPCRRLRSGTAGYHAAGKGWV